MKYKQYILNLFVVVCLIATIILMYETKYDTTDIHPIIQEQVAELKANQEVIIFDSKNPFSFYDVFHNFDNVSDQEVYGVLTYPEIKKDQYPVIIGVAGSLGWSEHHYEKMQLYLDMGIATFALHSFKSRGVASTVGEQVSVTIPMVINDAYMALAALSSKQNVDIDRVGITGWSLGGGVSLFSAWKPMKDAVSPDYSFAVHLPYYPPCFFEPEDLTFTDAPIHILIGEIDDWVPAEPCAELTETLKDAGYNADITVYPNSHHSFDRKDSDPRLLSHAYSLTDCRLIVDKSGVVKTKDYRFPLSNSTLQKIGLAFCADRGATICGNDYARAASKIFSREFIGKHLLN